MADLQGGILDTLQMLSLLPQPSQCVINAKLKMAMTNGIRSVSNMYFSICTICSKVGNPAFLMSILDC